MKTNKNQREHVFGKQKFDFEPNTHAGQQGITSNTSNTKCCQTTQGWAVESWFWLKYGIEMFVNAWEWVNEI